MKTSSWMGLAAGSLALLVAAAGCGKKGDDEGKAKVAEPAPAPAPAPVVAPPAAAPVIAPRPGESFGGDIGVTGENPIPWKTAAGTTVLLGVLFPTGDESENARVVVAAVDPAGKVTETEVATVGVNMAYGHGVAIAVSPDGKALVRVDETGGSEDPGYLAAWRLAWDAAAGKPENEDQGNWDGTTDPPAWAASR